MRKTPTLFVRNPETHRLEPVVTPGCEWVLDGQGVATRKVDGTPVLIHDGRAYKRREVRNGRTPPLGFMTAEHDRMTGNTVGWVPIDPAEAEDRWYVQGVRGSTIRQPPPEGDTYELVGPMVQQNTEKALRHQLIRHDAEELRIAEPPDLKTRTPVEAFALLEDYLAAFPHEGIVWHRNDGTWAKVKRRDFGHPWPIEDGQ